MIRDPLEVPEHAAGGVEPAASLLVVDDSEANRDILSRRLRKSGYEVTVAEGGGSALELIGRNRYDLVILDLMMPDVSGLEVLRTLRRTWSPSDLPVIIATAKDESGDVVEGLNAGASDYVTKPLDYPVVLARVRNQLSFKRAVDQIKRLEADLHKRNVELDRANRRMHQELAAAARVQKSLLPTSLPQDPRATFAWLLKPCAQLAGDILNVFSLDDDRVAVYVLDVVGHGVASALLSVSVSRMLSQAFLRRRDGAGGYRFLEPKEVAEGLDQRLPWDPASEQFFTLLYGVLDLRTREWRFVSAGHPSPILVPAAGEPRVLPVNHGLPIGLGEEAYEEEVVTLHPGDRIYLYSDGITEALNAEGKPFQVQRLLETLGAARSQPLALTLSAVANAVQHWNGGSELEDDASLAAFEILK